MWKRLLSIAHAVGFTTNETTVILFLTGAILAGAGVRLIRGSVPLKMLEYAEAYRRHDSLFAARSSAIVEHASGSRSIDSSKNGGREVSEPAHGAQAADTLSIVNLNTASQAELESLPGVGPSTATKIVAYRASTGRFRVIRDIMNVPGIGPKKFDRMKARLTTR
jgi:competence protein ComEA